MRYLEKKKRKRVVKNVESAPVTETVVEADKEEAPAFASSPKVEEISVAEEIAAPVEAPAAEIETEKKSDNSISDDDSKKKVTFFGRLFGRK